MATFKRTPAQKYRLTTKFDADTDADSASNGIPVTSTSRNSVSASSSSGEFNSKQEADFEDISSLIRELRHSGTWLQWCQLQRRLWFKSN